MVTPDRPEWTEKLRVWLSDTQYGEVQRRISDAYEVMLTGTHAVESVIENAQERLETVGLRAMCLYYGHKPIADGIDPEDDKCEYCEKPMPNSAHGPQY